MSLWLIMSQGDPLSTTIPTLTTDPGYSEPDRNITLKRQQEVDGILTLAFAK